MAPAGKPGVAGAARHVTFCEWQVPPQEEFPFDHGRGGYDIDLQGVLSLRAHSHRGGGGADRGGRVQLFDLRADRLSPLVRRAGTANAADAEDRALHLSVAVGDGRASFLPGLRRGGHPDVDSVSAAGFDQRALPGGGRDRRLEDSLVRWEGSNPVAGAADHHG